MWKKVEEAEGSFVGLVANWEVPDTELKGNFYVLVAEHPAVEFAQPKNSTFQGQKDCKAFAGVHCTV
jgi:hypothetical protein